LKDIVKDETFNYFTTCEGGPSNGPAYEEIRSGISLAKQLLSQTKVRHANNKPINSQQHGNHKKHVLM
jgi:hypothetical protein